MDTIVPVEGGNLELTASLPQEMVECRGALGTWLEQKIQQVSAEAQELQGAYEHAKKNKWKHNVLYSHARIAEKRLTYYQKLKGAVDEGYYIVPNFPVSLFAIRTDKNSPSYRCSGGNYFAFEEPAKALPAGDGQYHSDETTVRKEQYRESDGTLKTWTYADQFRDVEFPIQMAKLQIMEATSRAMSLKIFDQFGILPAEKKKDPMIIGQIINGGVSQWSNRRICSFVIAWHLNTNVL